MIPMKSLLRRFLSSEDGPTAVEYAFFLVLLFAVALTAIILLGN